jgi:hypothetical protein
MNIEFIKYIIIIIFIISLAWWGSVTIAFMDTYKDCMGDMVDFFDVDKYCPVFCSDRVGYSNETGPIKWINFTVPNVSRDIQDVMGCLGNTGQITVEEYLNCSKYIRPI